MKLPFAVLPRALSSRPVFIEILESRIAPAVVANIDLSSLNGANGFKLSGVAAGEYSGFSVSDAGDVNGDGFDDVIVGALRTASNGADYAGASFVVFGKADFSATTGNLDLSTLNGTNGFKLSGSAEFDYSGCSVSAAGDVNGDGFGDLIIGARGANNGKGAAYVVFGKADFSGTAGNLNLSTLNGMTGFKLSGVASSDYTGNSVSSAGDVNGDGFADLIIGAYLVDANGADSGVSYVVFGKADFSGTAGNLNLSTLNGTNGFKLSGVASPDNSGKAVSAAGDVNGDGFGDLIVGAYQANANAGASYVVFGTADFSGTAGNLDPSTLNGTNGFKISGIAASGQLGGSVSGAGDVNGDGFDDLLIGASGASPHGAASGASYVIFGRADFFGSTFNGFDLATLNGTNGFKISGVAAIDESGRSVSGAGDVNGDGFDDLLVGASGANTETGESYVVFGKADFSGTAGNFDLASINGTNGFKLSGVASNDLSGFAVSGAGDVNGDGFSDVIIGAYKADPHGSESGASYVVFGFDTGAVTHTGGSGAQTLTGDASANVFVAGTGGDTMIGNGGTDVFHGGEGADLFAVSDLTFKRIVGGRGFDTLRLDTSGAKLDLTRLADNRLTGIEQIDITGLSPNQLVLDLAEVLNVSDDSNTLIVKGDADDTVFIGFGWTQGADEMIGGTSFKVFTQGAATLKVAPRAIATGENLELSTLNGVNGFKLNGVAAGDKSGYSVSDAGDVNGDGFDDVIIGARFADPNGSDSGASYVVFGKADFSATAGNLELSSLNGTNGFKLSGAAEQDYAGQRVGAAGDVNGDGFADLLIGAYGADPHGSYSGAAYIVFGKADFSGTNGVFELSSLNGTNGLKLSGVAEDDSGGRGISTATGDVNGDGFDDVIIGAYKADPHGNGSGASYVVFGKADFSATAGNLDLSALNGVNGFKLSGVAARDGSGFAVSIAGDVNGDGFDDLLVGAYGANPHGNGSGASYVVFGKADFSGTAGNLDLSTLNGSNGLKLSGASEGERTGFSVSGAGDLNSDGFDDLIIGGRATYIVLGKADFSSTAGNLDLSALNGTNGFKLNGFPPLYGFLPDNLGISVSSAGDVNGDGFDDLLVGASSDSSSKALSTGASYVVFGQADFSGTAGSFNLSTLDGTNGFKLTGVATGDATGYSVSAAGDVNGDGFEDVIVGAYLADPHGSSSGASYVVFGFDTGAVTHLGGSGAQTLTGTAGANVFVAGPGGDTMIGNGGADVFHGGEGADVIAISDLDFKRADGGRGSDTLRLDTSGVTLDLTQIADNKITGIEQIDITGLSPNRLVLDLHEVLALSDTTNTLIVKGDSDDVVTFDSGWTRGADEMIGGAPFKVFTQGAATLKIAAPVTTLVKVIDLSSLTGPNGFTINGVATGDRAGYSVSDAGDVNGDGFDDLLIGAYQADGPDSDSGASYVVFGKADFSSIANLDLSTLNGSNGFSLSGVAADDRSGYSVSSAGDVNGDGFGDLLIGAPYADSHGADSGASYVVFGKADFTGVANIDLSMLNGNNGFMLSGVADGDKAGISVSTAGDVNGDGFDDLLIGASYADSHGADSGATYVVFGKANFSGAANIDLSTLDGSNGFKLSGVAATDYAGRSVSTAGDINGDGFGDLLIGAPGAGPAFSGASYVVFGKADFSGTAGNLDLSALDGTKGFKLSSGAVDDYSGKSVSGAGDVNGDGFDDLLIGAPNAASFSGASYVVFGKADFSGTAGNLDLSTLNGTNGFKLSGPGDGGRSGGSVSAAGDLNGDGFDDLIIGAPFASPHGSGSGASYVVFGKADFSGTAGNLNLSTLDGSNGFKLSGVAANNRSGVSVSDAGDVNGDGFGDVIIGAFRADPHGSLSGASYVVFGFDTGAVTHPGGSGAQTLTGTAGANVFVAGTGGDTMIGNGGADVFHGGEGADVLAISDLTFKRIDGGRGSDTLRLDTSGATLDLSAIRDNRITGIEQIDLTGTGDNTLRLNKHEVLALSDHSNTLRIDGNAGDQVTFGFGWTQGANEMIGATNYAVFTQGAATLKIATSVSTVGGTVSINDATVTEGNTGTTDAVFTVSLSDPSSAPVTVSYSTANGTAIAPGDYTPLAPTLLTFAPNETVKTIHVAVRGETLYEQGVNETFFVNLTAIGDATLGDAQGLGTINNDDAAPANVFNIDAKKPFTFFDANQDKVTVKLSGNGMGTVTLVGDVANNADIREIHLTGTDNKSGLSVTVKEDKTTGNGVVGIGEVVVVGGALKSFSGKAADFTVAGLTAQDGMVKTVTARNLLSGEIITGGTVADQLSLTLGTTSGGTLIDTPETVKSLKAVQLGDGIIKAAAFGSINVTAGALAADINSVGAIAKITVEGGGLSGDVSARSFGAVSVKGGNFSGLLTSLTPAATLDKIAALKSLKITDGDLTGDVRVLGIAGAISVKGKKTGPGGSVSGASIVAGQIGNLTVAKNFTASIALAGADLGADHALGGGDDTFLAGSIGTVKIAGNVSGASVIGAGLSSTNAVFKDNDDTILGGIASVVKSFTIGGTADPDSYFAAGLFQTTPKIGGAEVVFPDGRFKVG